MDLFITSTSADNPINFKIFVIAFADKRGSNFFIKKIVYLIKNIDRALKMNYSSPIQEQYEVEHGSD